jgi:hypothetical protein
MRAFLTACAAALVFAAIGVLGLNMLQRSAGSAFATDGARIEPRWSFRQMTSKPRVPGASGSMSMPVAQADLPEQCDVPSALHWLMVDFGEQTTNEAPDCK